VKGRNALCFCGSQKKYKRCHLPVKEEHWRAVNDALKQAEAVAKMLPKYEI